MSNQRITEAECNEALAVYSDREKYLSLSHEHTVMGDALVDAGKIKQETGEWPTLAQVEEKWMQEAAERERKRLASWQAHYRFTQKDFAEHEALLAREESGPFMD